jgi:hypothetical protein
MLLSRCVVSLVWNAAYSAAARRGEVSPVKVLPVSVWASRARVIIWPEAASLTLAAFAECCGSVAVFQL